MKVAVTFGGGRLEFEVEGDRLVGHRDGPSGSALTDPGAAASDALANPLDFPSFSRAVVPGDRVTIALDPDLPDASAILGAVVSALRQGEVGSIEVVSTAKAPASIPEGVTWHVHEPDARDEIAYLATTEAGRRIYLNRLLTDADLLVPIGVFGHDTGLGHRGPWSTIYPGLSDRESLTRARTSEIPIDPENPTPPLLESVEVSWLLGCQFHVGVVPAASGVGSIVAGLESSVRSAGIEMVDLAWSFEPPERADVVVVGVGGPERPTTIDDLAAALATAVNLVRRGGKIVALSDVAMVPGPALRRLAGADDPRAALARLRGREADPDYPAARRVAAAIARADVYLSSGLDPEFVDDLGIVPLGRPEEARKLAAGAASCILLGRAERTRAIVRSEVD